MLLNSMAESIPNRGGPSICQGSSYGGAIHFLLTGMERVQVSGIPETWEFLRGLELAGIFFGAVYLEFVIVGHAGNLQPVRGRSASPADALLATTAPRRRKRPESRTPRKRAGARVGLAQLA